MEESSGEEPQEKKGYKQPYNDFKTFSESIEGYCWDNEMLTILPEIDSNPSDIELPKADCVLALTYQPGSSEAKNNPASQNPPLPSLDPKTPPPPLNTTEDPPPPLDFENVFLHALLPPTKPPPNSPKVSTAGFSLTPDLMLKLQRIAPLINASGKTSNNKAAVRRHVRSEVAKHLGHIPFLNDDKLLYWEFAVEAYEKFQLGNLITFILEEGKKKNWVGDSKENPGWSILTFKGLVQLAHMYPPIRDSGAKLGFKVVQLPSGYYLREILLYLTKDMEPAQRSRSQLVYQNASGKRKRGEEYKELMCFSANINFKLDGVGADAVTEAKVDKEVDVRSEKKKDEAAEEVSPEVEKSSTKKEKKKHKKKEDKEDVDAAKKVKVDEEVDVRSERKVDEEVDVTSEKKDKKKGEATVEEASAQVEKSSFKKEKKERDEATEEASPEVENSSSNKERKKNKKKKKDKEEVDAAKEVKVDEEVDVGSKMKDKKKGVDVEFS